MEVSLILIIAIILLVWVIPFLFQAKANKKSRERERIENEEKERQREKTERKMRAFNKSIHDDLKQILLIDKIQHLDVRLNNLLEYEERKRSECESKKNSASGSACEEVGWEISHLNKLVRSAVSELEERIRQEIRLFKETGKTMHLSIKRCNEVIRAEEKWKEWEEKFPYLTYRDRLKVIGLGYSEEQIKKYEEVIKDRVDRENAKKAKREREKAVLAAANNNSRKIAEIIKRKLPKASACPYCQGASDEWHADHIMPISLGGLSTGGNMINVCAKCNLRKGDKTLRLFCRSEGFDYIEVIERLERQGKVV